jgi:hypothetical protein
MRLTPSGSLFDLGIISLWIAVADIGAERVREEKTSWGIRVAKRPLTVTRPLAINASQARREP